MRVLSGVLIVSALITGGCVHKKYENPITKDTEQPDKILFDKAIKDIEHGRYEVARLTLNTLLNTYDTSEYTAKAKLAIADSWMREGGSHGMAQAEAEYKDFILFYPTMEESAEAQSKICDMQYKQMDKADRDNTHTLRAEEECRQLLNQFPNSRFAPQTAQRLREIQEVIAESEYKVGSFYHQKQSYPAAANRLHTMTDHYPLYSRSDEALLKQGESYEKMGPRFKEKSIQAYQKLVREYPLSPLVDEAKRRLKGMEAEIPEPDPVAVARMKYEQENATPKGRVGKAWAPFASRPDTSRAAKSGQPASTSLRPGMPASIPIPGAGAQGGVTDVTVATGGEGSTNPKALDTQPDARMNQPAPQGGDAAAAKPADNASGTTADSTAAATATATTDASQSGKKQKQDKKKKQK